MENILNQIKQERKRQNEKWGERNHKPIEWCAILGEEVGEVNKEALEFHFENKTDKLKAKQLQRYREELIQVAAVAVQMIQSLDRNERQQIKYIWNDELILKYEALLKSAESLLDGCVFDKEYKDAAIFQAKISSIKGFLEDLKEYGERPRR